MVYSISGNKAIINGQNGIYDAKPMNPDVKYGRNAVSNYKKYTQDIGRSLDVPLEFEYRYVPDGKYSKMALMGSAYEELGKKTSVSVAELDKKLEAQNAIMKNLNQQILERNPNAAVVTPNSTAEALDLNGDGQIDVAEYATSTMAADMLDKNQSRCDVRNLDGVITQKGEDASMKLYEKENVHNAKQLFSAIYEHFDLGSAKTEFMKNVN